MRKALAIMGVLSVLGFGSADAEQQNNADRRVTMLKVSGMVCSACAATVERTVKKIDGVQEAKVSQSKGTAEITYDPAKISPEALAKAINEKTSFKAEVAPKDKK